VIIAVQEMAKAEKITATKERSERILDEDIAGLQERKLARFLSFWKIFSHPSNQQRQKGLRKTHEGLLIRF
jgi:hypothetical protein